MTRQRGRPGQAGGAVSQQVEGDDRRRAVRSRELAEGSRFSPAVARLVEVHLHASAGEIDDVGGAGTVDVGGADTPPVEEIGALEPRRVVHGDLGAEPAVT